MKRALPITIVVIVVVIALAQYKISSAVTNGLEDTKAALSPFMAMEYSDVSTTLTGDVEISDLKFTSRTDPSTITVDKVAFQTGSPWALLNLRSRIQAGMLPDYLQLSIQGISLNADIVSALEQGVPPGDPYSLLETAGCGEHRMFGMDEFRKMGYDSIKLDWDVGYQLLTGSDQVELTTRFRSHEQFDAAMDLVVSHGGAIKDLRLSPEMATAALLKSAKITYEDLGYADRIVNFCAGETGMSNDEYREHHVKAWQAQWQAFGLHPSQEVVDIYQDFIDHPKSTMTFKIEPWPALDLSENYLSPDPVYLSNRLNPELGTERTGMMPVSMAHADSKGIAKSEPESAPQTEQPAPKAKPDDRTAEVATPSNSTGQIALAELSSHVNKEVNIALADGRAVSGRIQSVENDVLKLKRNLYGGNMVVPFALDNIESVKLQ